MDGRTFYSNIQSHDTLDWLGAKQGATPAEDVAIILNTRFHTKFAVSIPELKEMPWDQLEAVLLHQRDPKVMTHVTRIVGYYSQLQNWNASKLAELDDRHRGIYSVPEVSADRSASAAA
jgi:hypothetical protein